MVYNTYMIPISCSAYYYGGLPIKGSRRKGRLCVKEDVFHLEVPGRKGADKIDLKIPFSRMERLFLSQDNYYGTDTILFNLAFRDQAGKAYTLRFAPITIIPRRRIALQKKWFGYLADAIQKNSFASSAS